MHPRWPSGPALRRWFAWALGLGLLLPSTAFAQGPTSGRAPFQIRPSWLRFRPAIDRFDSLEARGRRKEAWVYLDSLVAAQRTPDRRSSLVQALIKRGGTRSFRGDYRRGEADLLEARAVSTAIRDTLGEIISTQYLAYSAMSAGDFRTARPMWTRVLALSVARRDESHEGWARMGLAYIDLRMGHRELARRGYERVCRLMERCGDTAGLLEGRTGLANALNQLGRNDEAARAWQSVAEEAGRVGLKQIQGNALVNLADAEVDRGDPLIGLRHLEQANQLFASIGLRSGQQDVAMRRAELSLSVGRFDEAVAAIEPTLEGARRLGAHENYAGALSVLASIRRAQGRFGEGEQLLRTVRAIADSMSRNLRVQTSTDLASLLIATGRPAEALQLLDSLRAEGMTSQPSGRISTNSAMALLDLGRPREALRSLDLLGPDSRRLFGALLCRTRAWRALGELDSSRASLRAATDRWKAVRERPSDPEWREGFGRYAGFLVPEVVETALAGANPVNRRARERWAFEQLQSLKAVTLLERMDREPLSPRSEEGAAPLTLTRVQRALGEGEVLLDAHTGAGASVMFAVTRTSLRMVRMSGDGARIRRALDLFSAPGADPSVVSSAAAALAADLLPGLGPVLSPARRVIVATSGPLDDVPFALLPAEPGAPPLLLQAEVVRTPSSAVFVRLRERALPSATGAVFAFAGGRNAKGERLTGATDEVRWLAKRYAGVEAMTSSQVASTSDLARRLSRFQVLHLAGHASHDVQRPWRSGLLVDGASSGDEYLRAAEIARLRLPARLVVLSACQSAGGWSLAEGARGLASAFMSARVPAVVATQWSVRDETAAAFTTEFYPRLAAGQTVSAALRGAQLALRSRAGTSDAADWAAFVLVGEPSVRVTLRPAGLSPSLHARP